MIRINLLGGERKAKAAARFDASQQLSAICGVMIVAAVAGIGYWYWALGREGTQLDAQIQSLTRESARLNSVMAEVKTFQDRKNVLQQRVALIERLRQGQTVPVQLLDHVSRSLPEMLWLTDLKEEGEFLTIEGRTTTLIGLSDFVNNLGTSDVLHKPIEILDSAAEGADSKPGAGPELIKFTVRAGLNGLRPQEDPAKGGAKKKVKS
jgi:type IV pilus assembly protein PilN